MKLPFLPEFKVTTMKNIRLTLLGFLLLSTLLAVTAQQFGDFTYSSDGSAITITGYTGPGGAVTIPDTIAGRPVTRIGNTAFGSRTSLTSVMIPGSVTNIGPSAFYSCISLANVTIPDSVTRIGNAAFAYCTSLKEVYFKGNTPSFSTSVFNGTGNTVYYLPGTTGWSATFDGRPTRLWNPHIQTSDPSFGVGPGGFGFNITGTPDIPILVEASANLANATWVPLQSRNLTNGAFYFSDPNWVNYPARSYRIRSP